MKHMVDPRQSSLFDPERSHFSPLGWERLEKGWPGVFRRSLLEVMPAAELGEKFSALTGRPTKELFAISGLVMIAVAHNWTAQQAADAYMFDLSVQYALNLGHHGIELAARTVERYQRLFRENELAQLVFERVTKALIDGFEIEVDKQRLDSTHLFSNMANLTRTGLMRECLRRFLIQLKRHWKVEYEALDAGFRDRCMVSHKRSFGQKASNSQSQSREELRLQAAEDLLMVVDRFAGHEKIVHMSSYKAMVRVFQEQCEVVDQKVALRKKPGGRTMQNPSDPDATYDGHKGKGYQVQIAETCNPDNSVQLITHAIPQTAADDDGEAVAPVVEHLETAGHKPAELFADTLYGSDSNQQLCESKNIELIAPVRGPKPRKGLPPKTDAQKRLAARRELEKTDAWKQRYKLRIGIEGTNSGIKRKLAMGRLRVRGKPSVYNVVLLKLTGWNIFRAVAAMKSKRK